VTQRGAPGRVLIIVRDRGMGIEAENLPRVWEPYFTTRRGGPASGSPSRGTFVDGLGGSIAIESGPSAGTEVRIELPERRRARRCLFRASARHTSRASILIADDEEKILIALRRALEREATTSWPPCAAGKRGASSTSGSSTSSSSKPDARSLRAGLVRDVTASIPEADRRRLVMMTAHATVESAIAAMKLGARDLPPEPFEVTS